MEPSRALAVPVVIDIHRGVPNPWMRLTYFEDGKVCIRSTRKTPFLKCQIISDWPTPEMPRVRQKEIKHKPLFREIFREMHLFKPAKHNYFHPHNLSVCRARCHCDANYGRSFSQSYLCRWPLAVIRDHSDVNHDSVFFIREIWFDHCSTVHDCDRTSREAREA